MIAQIRFEKCVCDEKGHILVYCTTPELAQVVTRALNHVPHKAAEEDALGECLKILRTMIEAEDALLNRHYRGDDRPAHLAMLGARDAARALLAKTNA